MTFLLRNWRYVFFISCALAFTVFGFYIRGVMAENRALKIENARLDEDIEQAVLEINQCNKDKTLSEKVSRDYQSSITALRRQLNGLRDDPTCVPTESSGAGYGNNGTSTGAVVSGRNGLKTGYLFDYAGRAEETRLKLLGCQNFINELYKSRGVNE